MRKRSRLEWSIFAQADRNAIFDYIEADSPHAAIAVDERIWEQVEVLGTVSAERSPRPHRGNAGVGH